MTDGCLARMIINYIFQQFLTDILKNKHSFIIDKSDLGNNCLLMT